MDLVEISAPEYIVLDAGGDTQLIELQAASIDLVEVAEQGPAGAPGIPGPAGGASMSFTATTPIGGHRVLALDASGAVIYADNSTLAHAANLIGLSLNAASSGGAISVLRGGEVIEPTWTWTPLLPVYLGINGLLTQTAPVFPAAFSLIVGFPIAPDTLFFAVREPIILT